MTTKTNIRKKAWIAGVLLTLISCLTMIASQNADAAKKSRLKGWIRIDGSSTVFPISEAMAEEFQKLHRKVRVTVGLSGSGGGFKKFTVGETDISDASRPIKPSEREKAKKHKITYIELPVAYDGISLVIHPSNKFATTLTVEQLKQMWGPNSKITYWNDVNPKWPKKKINFYMPGADSGTFDYFTKAITGKSGATRQENVTASEDDNVLVQGVAGDPFAIGYFGYAYYAENMKRLGLVSVDNGKGKGPIAPSRKTIENATYKPLSRPIFIYVNTQAAKRPEVEAFVNFYLENATKLVPQVGYVPFSKSAYKAVSQRFKLRNVGTVFGLKDKKSQARLEDLVRRRGQL